MARWDSLRKKDRNLALLQIYNERTDLSLREIGKIFGVTRQRVWAIVEKYKTANS